METQQQTFENGRRPWLRWLKFAGLGLLVFLILWLVSRGVEYRYHSKVTTRLQETLTELDHAEPGWRLEDIEAAREQVPEEENSARVVVAASQRLPRGWPPQEFEDLFADLTPAEQFDPDVFARLKKELADLQPALTEAHKLAEMPRGRHHLVYKRLVLETPLPDQVKVRPIAHLLDCAAMRYAQDGDMEHALISCRAALNAARSLGDEPIAHSQFIRNSCVIKTCRILERMLAQGEPPTDGLTSMQRLLRYEDAFPDMLLVARAERAALHATFEAIESGDLPLSKLKYIVQPSKRKDIPPNGQDSTFRGVDRDKFREAHPAMIACMSRYLDIARLPMHEQAAAERRLYAELRELKEADPLAALLIPALNRVNDTSRRKHAYLRCLTVALAAERYRRANKSWPEALDKLYPQFLAEVPLDPYDGELLRYRRVEDGIVIYTVGSDEADNNGNLDPAHPNQPGVDVGYRLWDVAKRRQPSRPKLPEADPGR